MSNSITYYMKKTRCIADYTGKGSDIIPGAERCDLSNHLSDDKYSVGILPLNVVIL